MNTLLLEIGVEEIPAGYLPFIVEQLGKISEEQLKAARISFKDINVWFTLRRLVLYCCDVAEQQTSIETEIFGPPEKVAFINGAPTVAASGFARKYGVDVSRLIIKNGKVCILSKEPSLSTESVLPEVFKKIITTLSFPKTMVWESSCFHFVRPIRWLCCLYGKKIIKFQIADVKTSNWTSVRYCKKSKITEPKKFADTLRNKTVVVKQNERLEMLKKTVASAIRNTGELTDCDDTFEMINNMVEFPTAILCEFAQKFLNLPEEIIVNTVKKQKNFVLIDKDTKKILTSFVGVKDGVSTNLETIREGYEKVITARLEDAEFYFKNDTKTKLEEKVERLKGIVFQEKLGTIYDKVCRIQKLAEWLSNNCVLGFSGSLVLGLPQEHMNTRAIERICFLCKADLSTETVSEFPELQGVFGKICALRDGEDKIVADGIEQHWWSTNYDGRIPETIESSIVSIADKIDTLVGDFSIGLVPSASGDPYGLRRAMFGIVRIAVEKKLSFSVDELMNQAIANLPINVNDRVKVISVLKEFLSQRFETYLKEKNILSDEINAVFSVPFIDIFDAYNRAIAVHLIRQQPDFEPIASAYKRIGNILKQAEGRRQQAEVGSQKQKVQEDLLKETEEKELYREFLDVQNKIEKEIEKDDYTKVLQELVSLRKPIDDFFGKVLVMDKDEQIKNNRITLLSVIYGQFSKIADFSTLHPILK